MNDIRTFVGGEYYGLLDMKTVTRFKNECHELALEKQASVNADHLIYGSFEYDENGKVTTARLYDGVPKTDKELEDLTVMLPRTHIYAIHKRA